MPVGYMSPLCRNIKWWDITKWETTTLFSYRQLFAEDIYQLVQVVKNSLQRGKSLVAAQ